jgi:hypothetical protein
MAAFTRAHALYVLRRVYGPDHAASLEEQLPERIDLDDPKDVDLLFKLGLTPDRLASELGGEL